MRKTTVKMLISVLGASAIASYFPFASYALEPVPVIYNLDVRIEGIEECLYDENIEIWGGETFTLASVLRYVNSSSLTITGIDEGYITDVNGDTAGSFGGWDGWMYTVNGESPVLGIEDLQVSDGDSILLYFGDTYGVGMQFPEMSYDNDMGILSFVSSDGEYDAEGNLTITENPVADMNVYFGGETFITDENGQVILPSVMLAPGEYEISYDKYSPSGLPLVLRSEQGLSISVEYIPGDVNGDRVIDASDASAVLCEYAKIATGNDSSFSEEQIEAGDTDGDGAVDSSDASFILSYYANTSTGSFIGTFSEFLAQEK